MGLLKSIAKVGLAPSAFIGAQILKGVGVFTKKDYGTTKEILASAVETKTGKALGGATALVGGTLVGIAATTTTAGLAISKAVISTAKAAPKSVKAGLATAATIAVLAPQTTKAILKSPEATATAAAAIVSPAAGVVVGLEKGTGLLSQAIKTQAPKISEAIETAAPYALGAGVLTAAAVGATKMIDAELPKETAITGAQTNTAVESPVLPETQIISATTGTGTTKRKKRRSKPLQQHFRQSVNIDIKNNNSAHRITKKYINAIALRN